MNSAEEIYPGLLCSVCKEYDFCIRKCTTCSNKLCSYKCADLEVCKVCAYKVCADNVCADTKKQ